MIKEILLYIFPVHQIVMVQKKYPQGGSVWAQRPALLSAYFTNSPWHIKREDRNSKNIPMKNRRWTEPEYQIINT